MPKTFTLPAVGLISPTIMLTVVLFPRTVRPQKTEDLSLTDLKIEIIDRGPLTEFLGQSRGTQDYLFLIWTVNIRLSSLGSLPCCLCLFDETVRVKLIYLHL